MRSRRGPNSALRGCSTATGGERRKVAAAPRGARATVLRRADAGYLITAVASLGESVLDEVFDAFAIALTAVSLLAASVV